MQAKSDNPKERRSANPRFEEDLPLPATLLSEILHKVGHEIGNPLTSIISLASILERTPVGGPTGLEESKLSSYAGSIVSEAWRVSGITERLVIVLSNRKGSPGSVNLGKALERTISRLRSRRLVDSDAIHISFGSGKIPEVKADHDQLILLLSELIRNAYSGSFPKQSSNSESAISENEDTDFDKFNERGIKVQVSENNSVVTISIRNIISEKIPVADLAQLFEPLETHFPDERHAGLGLTMAALISNRMGGCLEISEEPLDTGYQVTVTLQLRAESSTQEELPCQNLSALPQKLSVLIIEDEPMVATAIQKILDVTLGSKLSVQSVLLGGEEALELLATGVSFDAILCDLNLADMSGRYVLETLQSERPELVTRFAFLTGDQSRVETQRYLQSTARPYLHKPFEPAQLITLLTELTQENGSNNGGS